LVVVAQLVCDFTRDKNPLRDFLPVLSSFRRKILREQCTRPKAQTPRVESAEETGFQVMGYRIRGFRPTFCLSLAPSALPRRAAARISVSVLCFVACDALPHSPRYVGGRPSGPHSQLSPASLSPSSRLGVVPGRLPQLGVSACAGT
jgi:hypothetical protein